MTNLLFDLIISIRFGNLGHFGDNYTNKSHSAGLINII
jgi:hypothetical protein